MMREARVYTCGTLRYTLPQLLTVIFWLMVGGCVFSVSMGLPGALIPVQLRLLGTTETEKMLLLGTIGGVLNMTICPYIGFASDRYRSKWGRRIPFILKSLPFLCLALFLFAFTGRIGAWLASLAELNPVTATVIVIGIVMFLFQFFYMYVGSVIWYIFNDVIPPVFFGRVMGAFQVATTGGLALFNLFVFRYAEKHFSLIFLCGAVLYGVGMLLMCLMVREGDYPPPEEAPEREKTGFGEWFGQKARSFRLFLGESFSHRFYLLRYAVTICWSLTGVAAIYTYNFHCELGLDEALIGRLNGYSQVVGTGGTMLVVLLVSGLVNRWHPMRITVYNIIFAAAAFIAGAKWLFGVLPPGIFIVITVAGSLAGIVLSALAGVAGLPMEMLSFPKSRFGSFCSMQALLRSATTTVVGLGAARFFDFLRTCFPGNQTFHFRFVTVWPIVWGLIAAFLAYLMYREWGRLGGYRHYACPASWNPDGVEPMVQPESNDPSARWLKIALWAYDLYYLAGIAAVGGFWWYAHSCGDLPLARTFLLWAGIPAAAALACWLAVRRPLCRDLKLASVGARPRNGIPHHGMLLLVCGVNLGGLLLTVYQVTVLFQDSGAMYLMLQGVTGVVLAGLIYGVCRMERGIVTRVERGKAAA